MLDRKQSKPETKVQRLKLTARVPLTCYDAIAEIQRRYRSKTGRFLPRWRIVAAAIMEYAKRQGIKIGE